MPPQALGGGCGMLIMCVQVEVWLVSPALNDRHLSCSVWCCPKSFVASTARPNSLARRPTSRTLRICRTHFQDNTRNSGSLADLPSHYFCVIIFLFFFFFIRSEKKQKNKRSMITILVTSGRVNNQGFVIHKVSTSGVRKRIDKSLRISFFLKGDRTSRGDTYPCLLRALDGSFMWVVS